MHSLTTLVAFLLASGSALADWSILYHTTNTCNDVGIGCRDVATYTCCGKPPGASTFNFARGRGYRGQGVVITHEITRTGGCGRCIGMMPDNTCFPNSAPSQTMTMIPTFGFEQGQLRGIVRRFCLQPPLNANTGEGNRHGAQSSSSSGSNPGVDQPGPSGRGPGSHGSDDRVSGGRGSGGRGFGGPGFGGRGSGGRGFDRYGSVSPPASWHANAPAPGSPGYSSDEGQAHRSPPASSGRSGMSYLDRSDSFRSNFGSDSSGGSPGRSGIPYLGRSNSFQTDFGSDSSRGSSRSPSPPPEITEPTPRKRSVTVHGGDVVKESGGCHVADTVFIRDDAYKSPNGLHQILLADISSGHLSHEALIRKHRLVKV